jgi:hypothetical protein
MEQRFELLICQTASHASAERVQPRLATKAVITAERVTDP